jgi:hypothetical protein
VGKPPWADSRSFMALPPVSLTGIEDADP